MRRRQILYAAMGQGLAAAGPAHGATPAALTWRRRDWLGFGTTLSLRAGGHDEALLERALDASVQAVRTIEAQMSLHDPGSALSRLNREGRLPNPPPELLAVLRLSQWVARHSGGAFDVTVQPLWLAFDAARQDARLPRAAEVAAARARVGWQGLQVTPRGVEFTRPAMSATLNGVAQGYACDRVRDVLRAHGVQHALIDTGELAPLGHNPADGPWRLGLVNPRDEHALLARVLADGRCLATSADEPSSFSTDHRHHHIFDPASGYSPAGLASVTVAARSGALADALTKVMFVAGPAQIAALAARWQVDALWVDKLGCQGATAGWRLASA
ncbi:FAD:protein FMN transferase [Ideonella sp.]|uniref:FAD:protein FMN transferase n=1 Tax=Ideonella sp. TaxID=1929293 RepID=UPI0035B17AD0